jgi:hypothetical protein
MTAVFIAICLALGALNSALFFHKRQAASAFAAGWSFAFAMSIFLSWLVNA